MIMKYLLSRAGILSCLLVGSSIHLGAGFQRPSASLSSRSPSALQENGFSSKSASPSSSTRAARLSMWSGEDELVGSDRLKACFPYILPLLDGDQFGKYIYERIPPLGFLNEITLGPLVNIYHSIPFLGLLFFLVLTLGTRNNTAMSRGVRFNAQQAVMIDVALVFPELIANGFRDDPLPRSIAEPCSNLVFYSYMAMVIYSIWSNLQGKKPNQIPYISNFAELAVGPF